MTFNAIEQWISGQPATLTATRVFAEPWKWEVAKRVQEIWPHPYLREPCELNLVFHISPSRYSATAVANLLKATIDGMSHVVFAEGGPGKPGPWTRQDHWIIKLTAAKVEAGSASGVQLHLSSAILAQPTDIAYIVDETFVETFVGGVPAVWVGSGENEWKELVRKRVFESAPRQAQGWTAISLEFRLTEDRLWKVDIDNLVIPACQAVARAIYRGGGHAMGNVTSIEASKVTVASLAESGLYVRVREAS